MVESVLTVYLFNFWYHLSTMFLVTISRPNQYMIDSIPWANWSSIFTYVSSHTRKGYIIHQAAPTRKYGCKGYIVTADAKVAKIVPSSNPAACKKKVMQSLPIRHDSIRKVYNYILPASQLDSCSIIFQPLLSKRSHNISKLKPNLQRLLAVISAFSTTTAVHRHRKSFKISFEQYSTIIY